MSDGSGNLFAVRSVLEPTGAHQLRVVKTDSQGSILAQFDFGGSGVDNAFGATVDGLGNLVIAGSTNSPDFPLVSPLFSKTTAQAGFVVKLDGQLKGMLFSTRIGGTKGGSVASAVAIGATGDILVGGRTSSVDFPVSGGALPIEPLSSNQFGSANYAFLTERFSGWKPARLFDINST